MKLQRARLQFQPHQCNYVVLWFVVSMLWTVIAIITFILPLQGDSVQDVTPETLYWQVTRTLTFVNIYTIHRSSFYILKSSHCSLCVSHFHLHFHTLYFGWLSSISSFFLSHSVSVDIHVDLTSKVSFAHSRGSFDNSWYQYSHFGNLWKYLCNFFSQSGFINNRWGTTNTLKTLPTSLAHF